MTQTDCHFENDIWLDVVRGILSPESDEAQRHLDRGCEVCTSAYSVWSAVRDNLSTALDCGPREDDIQAVLQAFNFQRKVPFLAKIAEFTKLMFDSAMEPVPVGIRGGNQVARHLLHEADGTFVDLRIEREADESSRITGQVHLTHSSDGDQNPVVVFLVENDQRIVAHATSNNLGEFQLDYQQQGPLSMYLETGSLVIGIPLPDSEPISTSWIT